MASACNFQNICTPKILLQKLLNGKLRIFNIGQSSYNTDYKLTVQLNSDKYNVFYDLTI